MSIKLNFSYFKAKRYIDNTLSWSIHINEFIKLSKANGILSKLFVPKSTMISVYYAIFYSDLNHESLVWSLTTQFNLEIINKSQKKCIRIMNFSGFQDLFRYNN